MATKFTFDGPNLLAIIKTGVTAIDVRQEFYSAYKEELIAGTGDDLSKFPRMFSSEVASELSVGSVGANTLTDVKNLGRFYFFNNNAGWRIRPAEESTEVLIDGNLYVNNTALPLTVDPIGAFTARIILQRSVDAIEIIVAGGDPAAIADAVWDENVVAAHGSSDTAGRLLRALGEVIAGRANNATLAALLAVPDVAAATLPSTVADSVLDEAIDEHVTPGSLGNAQRLVKQMVAGNVRVVNSGLGIEVYDEDDSTLIATFDISADTFTQKRTL